MTAANGQAANTDRELWRKGGEDAGADETRDCRIRRSRRPAASSNPAIFMLHVTEDDGDVVSVRSADLAELERRYHGQRETIRKQLDFAREVAQLVDRGLGTLSEFRETAYRAQRGLTVASSQSAAWTCWFWRFGVSIVRGEEGLAIGFSLPPVRRFRSAANHPEFRRV